MTREEELERALSELLDAIFGAADRASWLDWPTGRLANAVKSATDILNKKPPAQSV